MNQIITLGPEDDLNTITASGFYRINNAKTNVPSGCEWGILFVTGDQNTALQIVSDHGNTRFFKRTYSNASTWHEWIPIAISTHPQAFDLPLAEGFIVYPGFQATYHKNQFGEVTVVIVVLKQDGSSIVYGDVLATLPIGFRPVADVAVPAEGMISNGVFGSALTIQIGTNGNIRFFSNSNVGAKDLGAAVTFLASS